MAREIGFGQTKGRSRLGTSIEHTREYLGRWAESGAVFGFLAVLIFFVSATWINTGWPPQMLKWDSIFSVVTQAAAQGIIAVGVTILMISGEFDLSVGSILGLSALVFIQSSSSGLAGLLSMFVGDSRVEAWGVSNAGFPGLLAIACALATGALLGLINGLLLVITRIPSFIVTLGTLYIYRSVMLNIIPGGAIARYTREADEYSFSPVVVVLMVIVAVGLFCFFMWPGLRKNWTLFQQNTNGGRGGAILGMGRNLLILGVVVAIAIVLVIDYAGAASNGDTIRARFFDILNGKFAFTRYNFRASVLWWLAIAAFFSIILTRTRYGNAVFATGGNPQAARAQGVNVNRVKVTNFVLSGSLAAVGGIMEAARYSVVEPLRGTGYELDVIAGAVIGGTLLSGGYGSIWGSVLGILISFMLKTGLVLINVQAEWYRGVLGIIMIVAVIINTNIRRQR